MGRPSQRTAPASAASTPRTMRIAVVLPAPLGPTKPKTWPGGTEKRQAVEGHHVAVAARQSVELEHPYMVSTILPSLPPARNRS